MDTVTTTGVTESPEMNAALAELDTDTSADTETTETPEVAETDDAAPVEDETAEETVEDEAPAGQDGDEPAEESDEDAEATPETPVDDDADYTVKEKNGKKVWEFKAGRGERIYADHKAAKAAEQIFGEPLTEDAVKARHAAFVTQEQMVTDFLSGDAEAQTEVLAYLARIAQKAKSDGEVGHDAMEGLAERFPEFLAEHHPKAYEKLEPHVMRRALDELYNEFAAAAGRDPKSDAANIFNSVQYIDNTLFGSFKKREDIKPPSSIDSERAKLAKERQEIEQFKTERSQKEWGNWSKETTDRLTSTVDSAIDGLLEPHKAAYAKFPEDFGRLKAELKSLFTQRARTDAAWQDLVKRDWNKAKMAVSSTVRATIQQGVVNRYKAKAEGVLTATDPEVKKIFARNAAIIKANSDSQHVRKAAAAARREPGTQSAPAKRPPSVGPNGFDNPDDFLKFARSLA